MLQALLPWVAQGTVFCLLLSLALDQSPGELRRFWHRPSGALRALVAALALVPLLATLLSWIPGLPGITRATLLAFSAVPGAPLAARRSVQVGTAAATALNVHLTVSLAAVVTCPFMVSLFAWMHHRVLHLTFWEVGREVLVLQLAPLALGLALDRWAPAWAQRLRGPLARVANLCLLALMGLMVVGHARALLALDALTLAACAGMTAGSLALGHLLGGSDPDLRTAIAVSSANRSPGLATVVVHAAAPLQAGTPAPLLLCLLLNFVFSAVYSRLNGSTAATPGGCPPGPP